MFHDLEGAVPEDGVQFFWTQLLSQELTDPLDGASWVLRVNMKREAVNGRTAGLGGWEGVLGGLWEEEEGNDIRWEEPAGEARGGRQRQGQQRA